MAWSFGLHRTERAFESEEPLDGVLDLEARVGRSFFPAGDSRLASGFGKERQELVKHTR